jgi:hypothetical protein
MTANGTDKNPMFGLYQAMVPAPNQPLSPTQQPVNNYYRAAEPDQPHNIQFSGRVDYNHSESSRFFIRSSGACTTCRGRGSAGRGPAHGRR